MNNIFKRYASIFLLMLCIVSGTVDAAISARSRWMIYDAAYSYGVQIAALFLKNFSRKQFFSQTEPYSEQKLAVVKRIVEPYVSTNELNDILSCIRQPKVGSAIQALGPCCFNDVIIIDSKILVDKTIEEIMIDSMQSIYLSQQGIYREPMYCTDVERAFLILHEYGHKVNHHYTSKADCITAIKVIAMQTPMIILRSYVPNFKYRPLSLFILSNTSATFGHSYLERQKEYEADEYAFNALKGDAPAGCVALEKLYKSLNANITVKASDDTPSIGMRVMMNAVDQGHPTIWSRYQHACNVAQKYGWRKEK